MTEIDCNVCDDLKEISPEFASQGITETVCKSLKNDTGLNPKLPVQHTDCEDLELMNDCLIGRPKDELEKYEQCDWKKFMRKFLWNLHEMLGGIICAVCGLWAFIHDILKRLAKLENDVKEIQDEIDHIQCMLESLTEVQEINFGEGEFIAGEDVFFRHDSISIGVSFDVLGMMGVLQCSVGFEAGSRWLTELGVTSGDEGWLVCELHINKATTGIKHIYSAGGQTINAGCYLASAYGYDGDRPYEIYGRAKNGIGSNRAPDQWGWGDGYHVVPPGWIYLQLRVSTILAFHNGVSFFDNLVVVRDIDIVCPEDE